MVRDHEKGRTKNLFDGSTKGMCSTPAQAVGQSGVRNTTRKLDIHL